MVKSQDEGFKKTLRRMLRAGPKTNEDVSRSRKSPERRVKGKKRRK